MSHTTKLYILVIFAMCLILWNTLDIKSLQNELNQSREHIGSVEALKMHHYTCQLSENRYITFPMMTDILFKTQIAEYMHCDKQQVPELGVCFRQEDREPVEVYTKRDGNLIKCNESNF